MDDVWSRVAVVVGTLAIAGAVSLLLRHRARRPERRLGEVDLGAGVYFFSSSTCDTCHAAREALSRMIPPGTFTEFAWEESPSMFETLGVDVVPATLVVASDGSAVLHTGVPRNLRMVGDP